MNEKILQAVKGNYNLVDYDKAYHGFEWADAEKNFSWHNTGKVNIAYEAIDRHVDLGKGDKTALIYRDHDEEQFYTFLEMKRISNQYGNLFKTYGEVKRGDRVFIFMPRSPEYYFTLLGVIKLGAIAGPLFEAFMEGAVKDRLEDSGAKVLVTTPEMLSRVPIRELPDLEHIFLIGEGVEEEGICINGRSRLAEMSEELDIEWVDLDDGMLLHYTSGSTGKPKGVLHAHRAMIQHDQTARWVLDLKEDDVYWCTADPGWVTGTSYGIFGPWLVGVTNVIVGGRFQPEYWYETIEKYSINVWYSAPTAFRMLMNAGDELIKTYRLDSLRHIASVGEPLNPEVIKWGMNTLKRRIHDTWWMTEAGAQLICNYPCMDIRAGSMGKPIPGVEAAVVDDRGNKLGANKIGNLVIKKGWPSMMKSIWNNPGKYESYFMPGDWYVTGDSAFIDEDGYFWFQGRIDDVIMTSGERVGPFEVESALLEHEAVAESGVIGKPDPVRGEIIKAFVVLNKEYHPSEELKEDIKSFVKTNLAAHAAPREIQFIEKLPKTRSGKIMRRVLKAWELKLPTGDLSTMED